MVTLTSACCSQVDGREDAERDQSSIPVAHQALLGSQSRAEINFPEP